MLYGQLRRDEDCHWFLIPESVLDEFDELFSEIEYAETDEELNHLYGMVSKFWQYRINDPFDLRIPLEGDITS